MALNPKRKPEWRLLDFSDKSHREYELFDSVVCEFTDIAGWPVQYYVMDPTKDVDELYGEAPLAEFEGPYETRLVYEPTEETNIIDVFGFSSDDTIQFAMIPKTVFTRDLALGAKCGMDDEFKPKPGDVVRTLWNNKLWEIVDVGAEQKIFKGKKLVWEFIMKPYRHGEQSRSANDMLFEPTVDDLTPEINIDTRSVRQKKLLRENEVVEEKSDEIFDYRQSDKDSRVYGYDDFGDED
jgi:hypothetical protein